MGHGVCAFLVVAVAASGAKARFTAEIDVVELLAIVAEKSGVTVVATAYELFNVFNYGFSEINAVFEHRREVVCKNLS